MDEATKAQVKKAQARHLRAARRAQEAREARAVVLAQAHRAGASYRALAGLLGISAPTVVELVKAGERLEQAQSRA